MSALKLTTLGDAADFFRAWLVDFALPLWASAGRDGETGAFLEALTIQGEPVRAPRRARVQARQVFVYAAAAKAELGENSQEVAQRGFDFFRAHYQRPDGLFAILADEAGKVLDDTPALYEQDFSLLAMAALAKLDGEDRLAQADRLLENLQSYRHPSGGFCEYGAHPFQSNAHMHLLEAVMAWEQLGAGPVWTALADELVALSLAHFIDGQGGFLREFFDEHWNPAAGDDGRWVEPGHQFEWAWLLERWGRSRGDAIAREAARTLFERGLRGVDPTRRVAVNVLWDDLAVRDGSARLWPQTEYLKAALVLGEQAEALRAANALAAYLDVPARGAWRDRMLPDGSFALEPAPASSFYHIMMAFLELERHAG